MTELASHQVLADLANWLVLALALGLVAHRWLLPARPASATGRPDVAPPDAFDLAIALGLVFLLRSQLTVAGTAPAAEDGPPEIGASDVLTSVSSMVLLGLVLLVYLRGARSRSLSGWFGLSLHPPAWLVARTFAWGVPTIVVVYGLARWVQAHVWEPLGFGGEPQEAVRIFTGATDPLVRILMAVSACVVAPVIEETLFRGFLYPVFRRFTDGAFAALFTALFFGVVHAHLGAFLPLSLLGLVLALAYERGGLLLPMALHALFNVTSIVLMWISGKSFAP